MAGFTLQETLVATVIGVLVVGGAGLALQSSLRSIQRSSHAALSREGNAAGLALLRSEVIGSTQLLFPQGTSTASTNLDSSTYRGAIATCQTLATQAGSAPFNPMFGLEPSNGDQTVIYGLGLGRNGTSYSLQRCGQPVVSDGSSTSVVLSPVIEGIAPMPCGLGSSPCPLPSLAADGRNPALATTLQSLSNSLDTSNRTPVRTSGEPALRIRTDNQRRLLTLISPNSSVSGVSASFTSADPTGMTGRAPLYLTARVSSNVATPASPDSAIVGTLFGIPVRRSPSGDVGSGYVFVIDRSQAMSTCSRWANALQSTMWYYFNPNASRWQGNFWSTHFICPRTRISAVINQMRLLYKNLPAGSWSAICTVQQSGTSCTPHSPEDLGSMRSRIDALNSGDPRTWGLPGDPWIGVNYAFSRSGAFVVYHITASDPSKAYDGTAWSVLSSPVQPVFWTGSSAERTLNYYVGRNSSRVNKIAYHTVAMSDGLVWPSIFSAKLGGTYFDYSDDPQAPP